MEILTTLVFDRSLISPDVVALENLLAGRLTFVKMWAKDNAFASHLYACGHVRNYTVKSVQSGLSDLKRPPEHLQSQCNYRPFIT